MDAQLRSTVEEETGADHRRHDDPILGQALMTDWLTNCFCIDQRRLPRSA